MHRHRPLIGICALFVALGPLADGAFAQPQPVGDWHFNTADPAAADAGASLLITGAPVSIEGPVPADGAVRFEGARQLLVPHTIAPNAMGFVNAWSVVLDVRFPENRDRYAVLQTDPRNETDIELEVHNREGIVGIWSTGYTPQDAIRPNRWYRLAIAVDNAAGQFRIYRDGELVLEGAPQPTDGFYALAPGWLLLFADNRDDAPAFDMARLMLFDRALTEGEAGALGSAYPRKTGNQHPAPQPGSAAIPAEVGAPVTVSIQIDEPDGDPIEYRVDWDGYQSSWQGLAVPGPIEVAETFHVPGDRVVSVQARDVHGAVSDWVPAATVTVTGTPRVELLTAPYLQNLKQDGVSVMWELNAPIDARLECGDGTVTQAMRPSGHGTFIYTAKVSGLASGTPYVARAVFGGYVQAQPVHFRTAPAGFEPFSFGVWGDSQGNNRGAYDADPLEPTKSMMAHMAASGVDFGVNAGDLAEDGNAYRDTRDFYLDRVAKYLGVKVPFYNAWGNHDDYRGATIRRFADLPSGTRAGFDPGFGSYSFNYSDCHFVCIDYANMLPDIHQWLEADLAAHQDARHTFVFIHYPPYCELWVDGEARLRTDLVPLLEKYGVDICFSGHTHEYERGHKDGVYYCVTGGGSWLDHGEPVVRDWPHMTVGGAQDLPGFKHGLVNEYVRVSVDESGWTAEVMAFEPDGTPIGVIDRFSSGALEPSLATEPVVHVVYFWFKDAVDDAWREAFGKGLDALRAIEGVTALYYGAPVPSDRDIVDDSFDVGLQIVFRDQAALDAYLPHPIHQTFLRSFSDGIERVQVYDNQ